MLGGAYLCYEGVEKMAHRHHPKSPDESHSASAQLAIGNEQEKIAGAVRTDFILSAEIIVITLGTVASATFATQVAVLAGIALLMTVGVYGLVAGIVKLDDAGLYLSRKSGTNRLARLQRWLGGQILLAAPWLMKTLSVVGTAAMFMVGGGIIVHGVATLHHMAEAAALQVGAVTGQGAWMSMLITTGFDALAGVLVGAVALTLVSLASKSLKAVIN
jgi:predicted DNA repair protein MutK